MTLLQLRELYKAYDDYPALESINLSCEAGEILCFLGPSGCGKTTLLRMVAGLETPDSGDILYDGRSMLGIPPHKREFGMMFQDYALFPHLDVRSNIAFGLQMQGVSQQRQTERVDEMLSLVGLSEFASRNVSELSGGERQRVALARSLAPQPRLLMLDEPLAALDRELRERLAIEIRDILKTVGVTAIFVTHDQSEAFAIADKVAVFNEGKLLQTDSPESLYTSPANETVARFLGFRNILRGPWVNGTVQTAAGFLPCETPPSGFDTPVVLIRPEGAVLHLSDSDDDLTPKDNATAGTSPRLIGDRLLFNGKVMERTFLGQGYRMTLHVQDTDLRFILPPFPAPPETGKQAAVSVPASSVVLLKG